MKNFKGHFLILAVAGGLLLFNGCRQPKCPEPKEGNTNLNSNTNGGNLKTLTLQPGKNEGKDAALFFISSQTTNHGATNSKNYGDDPAFLGMESTFTGNPGRQSSLIEFDLSSIPAKSTITSAVLSLYACSNCSQYIGGQYGHYSNNGNDGLLQRITTSWNENTVTWDTRPTVSTDNEVTIPSSSFGGENYPNIDVTLLVQDMVNNPATSHGFYLSMKNHNYYRSLIFASSDNSDASKHPKLVVQYK